eukprot:12999359-Alexandrium_andersonii.AAC.1
MYPFSQKGGRPRACGAPEAPNRSVGGNPSIWCVPPEPIGGRPTGMEPPHRLTENGGARHEPLGGTQHG